VIEYLFSLEWNEHGNKLVIFVVSMDNPSLLQSYCVYSSNFVGVGTDAAPLSPNKILEVLYV
jgi:hypothetical protein